MAPEITEDQTRQWLNEGREALKRAIVVAGSQEKFAEKLGVPQSTVSNWLNGSKNGVAAEACPKIELLFGIPREELRPDLYLAFRSPSNSQASAAVPS